MNSPLDYQAIFKQDNEFSKSYCLLNYAVDGYGLDQIFLLLSKVIDLYDNPIVLFSFTSIDLDRSSIRLTLPPKPYFTINHDTMQLQNPVNQSVEEFVLNNPPLIRSYFLAFITNSSHLLYQNLLNPDGSVFGDSRERIEPIKDVNRLILMKAIDLMRSKGIFFKIIVFHTNWRGESPIDKNDWRDTFLLNSFAEQNVVPIWSKSIIQQDAFGEKNSFHDYFLWDGHPSVKYIKLVAKEIEAVLEKN